MRFTQRSVDPRREGQAGSVQNQYQQSLSDALHHSALDARLAQDVVWSDARLATVGKLPPGDAPAHRRVKAA